MAISIQASIEYAGYVKGALVVVGTASEVAKALGLTARTIIEKSRTAREGRGIAVARIDTLECANCGEEVEVEGGSGSMAVCKNCGQVHRTWLGSTATVGRCPACGRRFKRFTTRRKYCSIRCRKISSRRRARLKGDAGQCL